VCQIGSSAKGHEKVKWANNDVSYDHGDLGKGRLHTRNFVPVARESALRTAPKEKYFGLILLQAGNGWCPT